MPLILLILIIIIGFALRRRQPFMNLSVEDQAVLFRPAWGAALSIVYFPYLRLWRQAAVAWLLFLTMLIFASAASTPQLGPFMNPLFDVVPYNISGDIATYANFLFIIFSGVGVFLGRQWAWASNQWPSVQSLLERDRMVGWITLGIAVIGFIFIGQALQGLSGFGAWS